MKHSIIVLISTIAFAFAFQVQSYAQDISFTTIVKQHFNETVQKVKESNDPAEQRAYLEQSFDDMLKAIDRIEDSGTLDEEGASQIETLKASINDKRSQLLGIDGFDEIQDEDLQDFTDYSQQDFEQANRNITISLTTALLIIIILLLL